MNHALNNPIAFTDPMIDQLRAEGVSDENIILAIDTQQQQRLFGAPILTLREICGLEQPSLSDQSLKFDHIYNSARVLANTARHRPGKGGLHITRTPVWAASVQTGSLAEQEFIRPLTRALRRLIIKAGQLATDLGNDLATKARKGGHTLSEREKLLVALTPSCVRVLIELINKEEYHKGCVTPAWETIAKWAHLSRSTVGRALRTLGALGLVEWIRRFDYTKDKDLGARSAQTSNSYRFNLPSWLAKLLGLTPPLPADEADRREKALEDHAAMLATVSAAQRRRLMPADPASRAALVIAAHRQDFRLAADRRTREFQSEIETPHIDIYSKRELKGIGLAGRYVSP